MERNLRGRESVRGWELKGMGWVGESKHKMFYQNFKCKKFYTNLPKLIWLTENILLLTKYFTAKQTL